MTIKIEQNIPMPKRSARGRPVKYPFAKMNVGDSFALPSGVKLKNMQAYCGVISKRGDAKFSALDMGDGSYRVFRTA